MCITGLYARWFSYLTDCWVSALCLGWWLRMLAEVPLQRSFMSLASKVATLVIRKRGTWLMVPDCMLRYGQRC